MLAELVAAAAAGEEAAATVELDQTRVGRLSRMDALQSQALHQQTNRMRGQRQERVLAALARFDDGSFGTCLSCGRPIDPARLDFDPSSFRCVACSD
jgi:DnaK suppressor protein